MEQLHKQSNRAIIMIRVIRDSPLCEAIYLFTQDNTRIEIEGGNFDRLLRNRLACYFSSLDFRFPWRDEDGKQPIQNPNRWYGGL